MQTFRKISANEIGATKTIPLVPEKVLPERIYDYGFLLKQRINITAQRDEMIAVKEKELAEVNELILEADKLGIK